MRKMLIGIAACGGGDDGRAQVANADALDDIKKSGKIRIAIDLGVPPYGMTDDKMQPTGSDVETAKLLATDWGLSSSMCRPPAPRAFPALQTGKADLVISTLSDHARARQGDRLLARAMPCCAR